jgi:hypothetical protein
MNLYFLAGLLHLQVSSLFVFLGSKNQNWLARPLARKPAMVVSIAALWIGFTLLSYACSPLASAFILLTSGMLTLLTYPYLGVVLFARKSRS